MVVKYLKKYENLNEPKVGDYIVCKVEISYLTSTKQMIDIIESNAGFIVKDFGKHRQQQYLVLFEDPNNIFDRAYRLSRTDNKIEWRVDRTEILFFSKDKEQCEIFISARKYNL